MTETAVFITERAAETICGKVIKQMRMQGATVAVRKHIRRGELKGYTATITHGVEKHIVTEGMTDNVHQAA